MTNAEIQVGEYVRTTSGFIAKCIEKDGYDLTFDNTVRTSYGESWDYLFPEDKDITKRSFNIKDLIEVGDYVKLGKNYSFLGITNKYEFVGELNVETSNGMLWEDAKNDKDFNLYSIITKEQLDNMEYKVGGDND